MPTFDLDLDSPAVITPVNVDDVADAVRQSAERREPIYPVGGGTSLQYGLPARQPGQIVRLTQLSEIVDYPARDMTITVQAGITMRQLAETLREQGQQLPLDVPNSSEATLGGVLATDFSGPRRYGYGTARDYVIGIQAIDGRGCRFAGGGRVVKNVAGYDFCKLLIGSLGTLGIVTEVTLKLKPHCTHRTFVACQVPDLDQAERMLAALTQSQTNPSLVNWLGGPEWNEIDPVSTADAGSDWLVAGLEGTQAEVDWMADQLTREWRELGVTAPVRWPADTAAPLMTQMVEFPNLPDAALTLQVNVVPSGTTDMIQAARAVDPNCSILSHAGNGTVIIRFREFPADGLSRTLSGHLRPRAVAHHGSVIVLANPSGQETTHQAVWGGIESLAVMNRIKAQFDPHGILNPNRFVYS